MVEVQLKWVCLLGMLTLKNHTYYHNTSLKVPTHAKFLWLNVNNAVKYLMLSITKHPSIVLANFREYNQCHMFGNKNLPKNDIKVVV